MMRLQKRVTWASDVNLQQVKLFLLEESPSQVGLRAQDHLQAKTSWLSHSFVTSSDENLPPGFGSVHPENQLQIDWSQIPLIRWKIPTRVVLNLAWQVVAGEESKEVESENQRELRVLEAVYPRLSAIPPNPLIDVEEPNHNNVRPRLIPITPIEEEDATIATSSELTMPYSIPSSSSSFVPMHETLYDRDRMASSKPASALEPNVIAAALGAIMNGKNEQGNIDPELLMKILSNPKIIEKLVTDPQAVTRSPSIMTPSDPIPRQINNAESIAPPSSAHFYLQANTGGMRHVPDQSSLSTAPAAKDVNYYKRLIQQHGGDRQDFNAYKPRDLSHLRPKIMKPCMYFNTSKGCRYGANCSFQHDASFQQQQGSRVPDVQQNSKRMKFDREISS